MKRKTAAFVLLCLLLFTGCTQSMDDVIAHSPCVVGVVEEVGDGCIYIRTNAEDSPAYGNGLYCASTDVKLKDSMTHFSVDDKVAVYYSGVILESYPAILNDVQVITLVEPAVRETE